MNNKIDGKYQYTYMYPMRVCLDVLFHIDRLRYHPDHVKLMDDLKKHTRMLYIYTDQCYAGSRFIALPTRTNGTTVRYPISNHATLSKHIGRIWISLAEYVTRQGYYWSFAPTRTFPKTYRKHTTIIDPFELHVELHRLLQGPNASGFA